MASLPTRALLTAVASLALVGWVYDLDDDETKTVVCIGDSNTFMPDNWCAQLGAELPRPWRFVAQGIMGSRAWGWFHRPFMDEMIPPLHPDAVVVALGTNDVCREETPDEIAGYLFGIALRAAHYCGRRGCPQVFIATVPPLYRLPPGVDCSATIEATNVAIRAGWPPFWTIDFDSGMTPDDYWEDGTHLNTAGQTKRAAAAREVLLRPPP
jgi:lysophospholipase L1-like esterase